LWGLLEDVEGPHLALEDLERWRHIPPAVASEPIPRILPNLHSACFSGTLDGARGHPIVLDPLFLDDKDASALTQGALLALHLRRVDSEGSTSYQIVPMLKDFSASEERGVAEGTNELGVHGGGCVVATSIGIEGLGSVLKRLSERFLRVSEVHCRFFQGVGAGGVVLDVRLALLLLVPFVLVR